MSLFPPVDWAALERLMQPVKALLNEDLVSLAHTSQEARLRLWQDLEAARQGLRALAGALPAEVEARHRGELALAALRLAASFHVQGQALPGVTDTFTPEETELALGLEWCKALDVLPAGEVERVIRRGQSQATLDRLVRGPYQRLQELLVSTNVRKDVLAGVYAVYRARLDVLEHAVKAYLSRRVEEEGADPSLLPGQGLSLTQGANRAGQADGGGAPTFNINVSGALIWDGVRFEGGKATTSGRDGPGAPRG